MARVVYAIAGRTETGLAAAIVIAAIIFSFASPYFLTAPNIVDLMEAHSVTTVLAAGVFVVLVSGGIDISFTATASATQYLAAYLITSQTLPAIPALALAAALGIAMGCINALLIYFLRVGSIIITIATSSIYYALLIYFTNAEEIYNLPDWWSNGLSFLRYETADGDIVKITLPIVIMIAVLGLTQYLMSRTRIGRQVYALGGNPEAASRVGIDVLHVQLFAYGYLGLLAAVAGIVQAGRVPSGRADRHERRRAERARCGHPRRCQSGRRHRIDGRCDPWRVVPRHAAEWTQSARRVVLFLRRGHRPRHPGFRLHDRLCRELRTASAREEDGVMVDPAPELRSSGRGLTAELDRVLAGIRRGMFRAGGLFILLAALVTIFSLLMPAIFPRIATLQAMMFQLPELGLLSLAMTIPLISGGINLAIIATANAAGLLMAWTLTVAMPDEASGASLALWLAAALVAGLVLCIVVGVLTGLMIAALGVHPILVTLGTMTLLHGLSIYFTRGRTLSGFPDPLIQISNDTILGVPISFVLFVGVAILVHVLLTQTALGVRIHMIGSNLEATRYSGVDTTRVQIWVYVLSSLLCFLASVVMMARFNSAGADIAGSYLSDHHSRRYPGRSRSLWWIWPHWWPVHWPLDPPNHCQWVQPHEYQPASGTCLLGLHSAASHATKRVVSAWQAR